MTWWSRRGLRFKIALGVSLILVAVLGTILYAVSSYIQAQLWQRELQMAQQMNHLVVATIEGTSHAEAGAEQIQSIVSILGQSEGSQIDDIALYARRMDPGPVKNLRTVLVVFASGFAGGRPIQRQSLEKSEYSAPCEVCHRFPVERRPNVVAVDLEGQQVLRSVVPLENKPACQACHQVDRKWLGISLVDFRLDRYRSTSALVYVALGGGGGLAVVLVVVALFLLLNRGVIAPLGRLVRSTQAVAQGEWNQRVPVRSGDELGRLSMAFNEMTEQLAGTYHRLQRSLAEREEQAQALQQALAEVRQGQEEQARLLDTIREMSTPVVPVHRGVLVMPLVGVIDSTRAHNIIEALLSAIEREQARVVILDITGVPMVDTAVAQTLLHAAQAARLLGATPVLVGISPQVAETVVSLGVDLSGLVTRADLQSGVSYALQQLGSPSRANRGRSDRSGGAGSSAR